MKRNLHRLERGIRGIAGLGMVGSALVAPFPLLLVVLILVAPGLLLLATALWAHCPCKALYGSEDSASQTAGPQT